MEILLEDISSLQSPCGQGEGVQQVNIEGGVAIVSRMLPSKIPRRLMTEKKRDGGRRDGGEGTVTAEQFARAVHDWWGVGKKACDNGFLLVASREDRSFAISVVRKKKNAPLCFYGVGAGRGGGARRMLKKNKSRPCRNHRHR